MIPVCEGEIPTSHAWLLQFLSKCHETTKSSIRSSFSSLPCFPLAHLCCYCLLINHECLDKKRSSYYQAQFSTLFFSMECWLPKILAILLAVKSNLYLDSMKLPKVLFIFSALSKSLSGWLSSLSNLHLLGIAECFKVTSHTLSRLLNEFPTCPFSFCFLMNPDCYLVFVEGVVCYKLFYHTQTWNSYSLTVPTKFSACLVGQASVFRRLCLEYC